MSYKNLSSNHKDFALEFPICLMPRKAFIHVERVTISKYKGVFDFYFKK